MSHNHRMLQSINSNFVSVSSEWRPFSAVRLSISPTMVRNWWLLQIILNHLFYLPTPTSACTYICWVWLLTPDVFLSLLLAVWWFSRGEVEGPDSDCQGAPWQTRQGVQPHQPGTQSSGQETEEGKAQGLKCCAKQANVWICVPSFSCYAYIQKRQELHLCLLSSHDRIL